MNSRRLVRAVWLFSALCSVFSSGSNNTACSGEKGCDFLVADVTEASALQAALGLLVARCSWALSEVA